MNHIYRVHTSDLNTRGDMVIKVPAQEWQKHGHPIVTTFHLLAQSPKLGNAPVYHAIALNNDNLHRIGPYRCDVYGMVIAVTVPLSLLTTNGEDLIVLGWSNPRSDSTARVSPFKAMPDKAVMEPVLREGGTWDLYSPRHVDIKHGCTLVIGCGYSVNIPNGHIGILSIRKQYALQGAICCASFIHHGYMGEISIHVTNAGNQTIEIAKDRPLLQLAIVPIVSGQ